MATGPDDTPTTSESSQEILGRFFDEWLQVLGKDEIKSIAMFLCFHLVTRLQKPRLLNMLNMLLPC